MRTYIPWDRMEQLTTTTAWFGATAMTIVELSLSGLIAGSSRIGSVQMILKLVPILCFT